MLKKSVKLFLGYAGMVVILILLTSFHSGLSGQPVTGCSINPKAGIYVPFNGNSDGFAGGVEFNTNRGNTLYSVDYFRFGEFTVMDPIPADAFNQIGFMIGTFTEWNFFRVQYQGGLGSFFGTRYTEPVSGESGTASSRLYEEDRFFTPALLAKLGFKIIPLNFLSLGIDLQMNVNLKQPVFFPGFSLEIGRLKK